MALVFRPTYHVDVPSDAKVVTRNGTRYAKFVQRSRTVEGEILPSGKCRLKTACWYARIRGRDGRTRRVPLKITDKTAATQLAIRLQQEADQGLAGTTPSAAGWQRQPLVGSAKTLPRRKHQRNRDGRIVRRAADLQSEDLNRAIAGSHLADYATHLEGAGRTSRHIVEVTRTIRRTCIACRFELLGDIASGPLDAYLARLISSGKTFRTRNATLKAMRAFVRWLCRGDRLPRDPLKALAIINEEGDPRGRRRRALEPAEFQRLLAAARTGPSVEGVAGAEREVLYLFAAATGLRRKELAALRFADLSLDTKPPFVHVPAANTKARRDDQPIPLHPFVAKRIRAWRRRQMEAMENRLFHLATRSGGLRKTSRMMQADCEAAGIPYAGDLGVADFHSHRVAFITALCRTADFSTVVDLARHSDPKLTAKVYDRVRLENRTTAINSLRFER